MVHILNPQTLNVAFCLAKMQEENILALRKVVKMGAPPSRLAIGSLSPEKRAIVLMQCLS